MIQHPDLILYYILAIIPFVTGALIGFHFYLVKNKEYGIVFLFVGVAISICIGHFIIQPIYDSYEEAVFNEIQSAKCEDLQTLSKDYEPMKSWYGDIFEDKIQSTYMYNCLEKSG